MFLGFVLSVTSDSALVSTPNGFTAQLSLSEVSDYVHEKLARGSANDDDDDEVCILYTIAIICPNNYLTSRLFTGCSQRVEFAKIDAADSLLRASQGYRQKSRLVYLFQKYFN